jgi:hypothetical protein
MVISRSVLVIMRNVSDEGIDVFEITKKVFTQLSFILMLRSDYYYMFRPAAIFR